ncbi:hypothetical protein [Methanobrevibacter sp.]|uniref:hypothetical protein n=1 Tax=Methanobrevibacter sp. TaxID=66852 RepID=UPI003870AE92
MEMTFNEALKNYVAGFGTGISVEKFVKKIYQYLMFIADSEMREKICILNDRYLVVNEVRYQFIRRRSAGRWEVKTF